MSTISGPVRHIMSPAQGTALSALPSLPTRVQFAAHLQPGKRTRPAAAPLQHISLQQRCTGPCSTSATVQTCWHACGTSVLGLVASLMLTQGALAADAGSAATQFAYTCAGCHAGGGNVVQAGATLSLVDLQRNGVSSVEEIYKLTYFGKGKMPGYGVNCTPRGQCTFAKRLSDDEIQGLSQYVVEQAATGWVR